MDMTTLVSTVQATITRLSGDENEAPRYAFAVEDAPEWIQKTYYAAHGKYGGNATRTAMVVKVLNAIGEGLDDDDDAERIAGTMDELGDMYTCDILQWLASDIRRTAYIDEVSDVYGAFPVSDSTAFLRLISLAQLEEYSEIFNILWDSLTNQLARQTGLWDGVEAQLG